MVPSSDNSRYRTKLVVYLKTVFSAVVGWRFSGEGEKNDDSLPQKGQSFFREAECFQLKENQVGKYEKVASFMKKTSK